MWAISLKASLHFPDFTIIATSVTHAKMYQKAPTLLTTEPLVTLRFASLLLLRYFFLSKRSNLEEIGLQATYDWNPNNLRDIPLSRLTHILVKPVVFNLSTPSAVRHKQVYLSMFNSTSLKVPSGKFQRVHNRSNCYNRFLWMFKNLVTKVEDDKAACHYKSGSTLQSQGRRWAQSVNCLTPAAARNPPSPTPQKGQLMRCCLFHKGGHKQGLPSLSFPLVPLLLDAVLFLHWVFFVSLLLVLVSVRSSVVLWQLHTPIKIKRESSQMSSIHHLIEKCQWQLYAKTSICNQSGTLQSWPMTQES